MKMKLSKIALAMAALGTAPAAFALTPAQITAGPTTYVWLSGNSAPSNGIFRSVMSLCNGLAGNAGTNDAHMYLESTGTEPGKSSGDRVAYACTMSSVAGSLAGKKVVVYHTVENGSFNAYAPHLSMAGEPNPNGYLQGNLKRVNDLASQGGGGKCAAGAAGTTSVILNGVAYNIGRYNSCDLATKTFTTALKGDAAGLPGQSYPDGGFSDTEYLINKQNLQIGTDLSSIGSEVATNIGQAFGVAVSYPLYYQLQKDDVAAGVLSAATCTTLFLPLPPIPPWLASLICLRSVIPLLPVKVRLAAWTAACSAALAVPWSTWCAAFLLPAPSLLPTCVSLPSLAPRARLNRPVPPTARVQQSLPSSPAPAV